MEAWKKGGMEERKMKGRMVEERKS